MEFSTIMDSTILEFDCTLHCLVVTERCLLGRVFSKPPCCNTDGYSYSVSILYGNIGIFRDLEAFLAQKSGGKPTNLQCTIGFCPWFWSRPPKLSWIKRIGFLTFIACHSKTNGCFQNFPAAFSSSVIELQQSSKQLFD